MNRSSHFFLLCALVLLCFSAFVLPLYAGEADTKFGEHGDFGLSESAVKGQLLGGSMPVNLGSDSSWWISQVLGKLAGSALTFVGVLFLLLMIYAGFLWMTGSRGGKDDDINKAKKIMTWAIAGLAVIFLSYTIVSFIINIAEQAPNPPTNIAPDAETGVPPNAG